MFENIGSYGVGSVSKCRAWKVKGIGERSTFYQRQNKTWLVNAASGHPLESDPGAYNQKSVWDSVKSGFDAFYRFSRPHTVIGTVKFVFGCFIPNKSC